MPDRHLARRLSDIFLCATPFLVAAVAAPRALRVSGVHHVVGGVLFLAILLAAWTLGGRAIKADAPERRQYALGGALLVAPFALVALLWVGLGTPWEASARENQMRYLVLIAMAVAEVGGFVVVCGALNEAGQRVYAALVLAAIMLAGPLYLVWDTFMFGVFAAREHAGSTPLTFAALDRVLDVLLDIAVVLTYLATAALAMALGRAEWLGRRAARVFVGVSFVALLFLANRGLRYLSPAELSAAWYTVPGFIVGIPAVPYISPFLLGVVLLRRAGEGRR
jgi:hypothetical protein